MKTFYIFQNDKMWIIAGTYSLQALIAKWKGNAGYYLENERVRVNGEPDRVLSIDSFNKLKKEKLCQNTKQL